ncbi:MAG: VOC family protein, partial [Bacteroidota bacterium]
MEPVISGIQQIGIGIPDVHAAFKWYRENLGMDIPIFEEAAEANLMLPYTGGKPHERHAILAINIQGGGGFEIWQYTSRTPVAPTFEPQLGDLGIFAARIKSRNVGKAYAGLHNKGEQLEGEVQKDPGSKAHFFVKDPYGNFFQIVEGNDFFGESDANTGGPAGAMMGVSDIEKSKDFYADILGYDKVIYDESGVFEDLKELPGGNRKFRRVLLTHSKEREGGFSRMFGSSQIELIQVLEGAPKKIFEGRYWGDLGYIHLCFDI